MSTEDKYSPGNYAFKDQSFILKWIQENIEHFGGDKNSVTIWGGKGLFYKFCHAYRKDQKCMKFFLESAGGASVHWQMISPLSQGLFHRAISHSGSLYECWSDPARPGAAKNQALRLANEVKCSTENSETLVNCLRNISAHNLTLAIANLYYWDYDPIILFPPVIEDFDTNEEKFVATRNFYENSTNIPWITGMNSEEMLLKLALAFENPTFYAELMEKFDEILPYTFSYYDIEEEKQKEVTKALNKFYFKSETPSSRETQDLLNV